jgi:subtilisin family serine protease
MSRIRSIAVAASTSLLVAVGAAGAAVPVPLQQIALQPYVEAAGKSRTAPRDVRQRRPGGLNQQVRPRTLREKFVAEPKRQGKDVYLVRLQDLPIATYDGRIKGLIATAGKRMDDAAAQDYAHYLDQRQQQVLEAAAAKGLKLAPRRRMQHAFNGFSVELDQQQAQRLAALPQVAYVQRSRLRPLQTDRGPEFVGASAVWEGDNARGLPYRGEGMVIGVLDSGINSDHPSFAATAADGYTHVNPRGAGNYLGDCASGAATCNHKLIGVWSWPLITNDFAGVRPPSGEDYNGHGSHTASTAAGNVVEDVPLLGSVLGDGDGTPTGFVFDRVAGVAPRANIVSYQVCFPDGGCPDEAVVTAIDQAIQDQVDVINFSIGGAEELPWTDAVALSFLAARESGIAIAASAGNAGPNFYTLSHSAPWYLAVAASTHDRVLGIAARTLTLSGGNTAPPEFPTYSYTEYGGISAQGITGTLVSAADAGDERCLAPFPAGTFNSNQIVVCKRGQAPRLSKANNVMAGGAGGFVLVNAGHPDDDDDLANDTYPLPGIQLRSTDGQALLAWMADGGSGHTATIPATSISRTLDASAGDQLADFSSRGPSATYLGNLAPGISAPGVDIFAAYADEHPFHPDAALSRDWAAISGTSMASPHVAGAMALVRQAHPSWTPSEVQSALQMTASETVSYGANAWSAAKPAGIYRAGHGRLDTLAAVDAGLVMHESGANFAAANPMDGGDPRQLNLPQLVNNHCRDVCSWIRTVKATRDGSWTVSAGPWTFDRWMSGEGESPQNGVKFEAIPSNFTLRAGETRSILIRVDLTDAQFRRNGFDHVAQSEELELWSKAIFTPDDSRIPTAHWPISVNFDHGRLPKSLELGAHRDDGSYRLRQVDLPAMSSVSYRSYGLARPELRTLDLGQDIDHVPAMFDGDFSNDNTRSWLVDVPAGSSRLIVETLENVATTADLAYQAGWATLYLGRDDNGNGEPDFDDETLCVSNTEVELNYCAITRPDAGRYWVFVNNVRTGLNDFDPIFIRDTYRIATAVVPGSAAGDLQITGPASSAGGPVDLDVRWTGLDLAVGEVAYGGFDIGSAAAPGSVGFVPLRIVRGPDDVSLRLSQQRARGGQTIDVTLHVRQNLSGADRSFDLQTLLPSGLTLVPGSVTMNNPDQRPNLSIDGSRIRIAGVQRNSEQWDPDYTITTSSDNPVCRTPIYSANGRATDGRFVGLVRKLGLIPDFGGTANHTGFTDWDGDFVDDDGDGALTLPLATFFGANHRWALYNNAGTYAYPYLQVSPQGWVIMDPGFDGVMYVHSGLPFLAFPYSPIIAPLWKGKPRGGGWLGPEALDGLATPLDVSSFDLNTISGMTVAYGTTTNDLIIEWSRARTERADFTTWPMTSTHLDDRYDFNLIINRDYRFGEGEFELMMAYDRIDFGSTAGEGTIGVQGYAGPLTAFGPLYGDLAAQYAHDDLKTKLSDRLVVCYDYTGPESTQFDLGFKVRVSEAAAGTLQRIEVLSDVEGMPALAVGAEVQVVGNMQIAAIADQRTAKDTTLSGIPVIYHDDDAGPNTISVSGAHVTAVVHGNQPGATIDLVPQGGWVGTTTVTVTVADLKRPDDRISTQFRLSVSAYDAQLFVDSFE